MPPRFLREFTLLINGLLACACVSAPQGTPITPVLTSASGVPTMDLQVQPPTAVRLPASTRAPTSTLEPSPTPDGNALLQGAGLVEALRQGGYVIYFRHTATDHTEDDVDSHTQNLEDCSKQRNLNEQGRADARSIGESFLSLKIPVGQVLSSRYCRARDTAMLAFGQAELTEHLTGFPDEFREQRIAVLAEMLSTPPEAGTNTVLVAHGFNIANTANVTIVEGEAAIFEPLGPEGFKLIARVLSTEWIALERSVVGSLQVGPASDPNLLLPDLETLPPTSINMRTHSVTGEKLLRFTNLIRNNGPGPIELWGYSDPAMERTIVVQRVYTTADSSRNVPVGEFIFHPKHDHWHMGDFARYELWSLGPQGELDSLAALSDKVSYCLRDDALSDLPDTTRFQTYTGCNQKRQGITPGWIDVYKYYLEGQSIDITQLPTGPYALRSIVNPNHQLWESHYENNSVIVYIEIHQDSLEIIDNADNFNSDDK